MMYDITFVDGDCQERFEFIGAPDKETALSLFYGRHKHELVYVITCEIFKPITQ